MARRKRTWRHQHYRVTDEWETCPDCSTDDSVSFTYGHVMTRAVDDPTVVGGSAPVLAFSLSALGKRCETCGGFGKIRVKHDLALPATN